MACRTLPLGRSCWRAGPCSPGRRYRRGITSFRGEAVIVSAGVGMESGEVSCTESNRFRMVDRQTSIKLDTRVFNHTHTHIHIQKTHTHRQTDTDRHTTRYRKIEHQRFNDSAPLVDVARGSAQQPNLYFASVRICSHLGNSYQIKTNQLN